MQSPPDPKPITSPIPIEHTAVPRDTFLPVQDAVAHQGSGKCHRHPESSPFQRAGEVLDRAEPRLAASLGEDRAETRGERECVVHVPVSVLVLIAECWPGRVRKWWW